MCTISDSDMHLHILIENIDLIPVVIVRCHMPGHLRYIFDFFGRSVYAGF